jgi:bla regulator protein BlaR1
MIGELTNHIWQSTILAGIVSLITLAFRKSRAHVRYWLWLSASLKLLLPFSLFIGLGSRWEWVPAFQKIAATPAVAFTVVQMSQPFAGEVPLAPIRQDTRDRATIGVLGVWVCGLFTIVLIRWRGWCRIRAALRSSAPLAIPATIPIEICSSPELLEPGVVGPLRPTLLFPASIVDRLKPPQWRRCSRTSCATSGDATT